MPIGVKDVLDTGDMPTAMGSPIYAGNRPRRTFPACGSGTPAGAAILGKTVTCELAGMAPAATTHPQDFTRTPGGPSSGSAAAVAEQMVPLAFGTQTGGSIIHPAAYCGLVGYKPTYSTFDVHGMKFAARSLDTVGVIARIIGDGASGRRIAWTEGGRGQDTA